MVTLYRRPPRPSSHPSPARYSILDPPTLPLDTEIKGFTISSHRASSIEHRVSRGWVGRCSLLRRSDRRDDQGGSRLAGYDHLLTEWFGPVPSNDQLVLSCGNLVPDERYCAQGIPIEEGDPARRRPLRINDDGQESNIEGERDRSCFGRNLATELLFGEVRQGERKAVGPGP